MANLRWCWMVGVALMLPFEARPASALLAPDGIPVIPSARGMRLVSDGSGGAIAVWLPSTTGLRASRFDGSGTAIWSDALVGTTGTITSFEVLPDGAGGALVGIEKSAVYDHTPGALGHVDGNGNVRLSTTSVCSHCTRPSLAPDGLGGVFAAWQSLEGADPILLNHFAGDALDWGPLWMGDDARRKGPNLAPAGAGSVWAAWRCDIQRWDRNQVARAVGSLPNCLQGTSTNGAPVVISDGAQGAFVAWQYGSEIRVMRVDSLGNPAAGWIQDGALAGLMTGSIVLRLAADGHGGVLVGWSDPQSTTGRYVMVQRIAGSGQLASGWPMYGVQAGPGTLSSGMSELVPDGDGGVYVAWTDRRYAFTGGTGADIFAQHLTAGGAIASGWAGNGSPICTAPGGQSGVSAVSDGAGGVLFGWADSRSSPTAGYLQRVLYGESLPPPLDVTPSAPDAGFGIAPQNPGSGGLACTVTLSDPAPAWIALFDAGGRRVGLHGIGPPGTGTRTIRWAIPGLRPGVYLLRLVQGRRSATAKTVVVD